MLMEMLMVFILYIILVFAMKLDAWLADLE